MNRYVHHMPFGAEIRADGTTFRIFAPGRTEATVVVDN